MFLIRFCLIIYILGHINIKPIEDTATRRFS